MYLANASIKEGEGILNLWQRSQSFYLCLAKMAQLALLLCVCSTESERVFDTAGALRSKQRCRLAWYSVESLILVGDYLRQFYSAWCRTCLSLVMPSTVICGANGGLCSGHWHGGHEQFPSRELFLLISISHKEQCCEDKCQQWVIQEIWNWQ